MRPTSQFAGYNNNYPHEHPSSSYSVRKDSGISFDEPIKKKQRVASMDDLRSRKLPELYHPYASPPQRRHNSLFETPSSTMSTSSSVSSVSSAVHPLELPSLTAVPPPPPLIHHHHHSHHGGNTNTGSNGRRSSSIKSNNGSRTPGQFLCEHVVDPTTQRICGQTFRRSYDLSRHQSIHMKNRPFCYCNHCGKKFTRMDALRRHERVQGHFTNSTRTHRFHTSAGQSV
ncbi:hypothetical protein BDA99DRAFT_433873 [Phascolomyces articulosus]|uniref:C2H2-type domain-containing protein n=1 Tax=Phascolomyces articulosus TaxID=60185 RepID=A0AAD5K6Z3_9FUNG|nr:hypothetical protein BDA99DRAFT_433873 [Phascolomyces articulosus]